jgi:mono/diheme cytochrome c family protein
MVKMPDSKGYPVIARDLTAPWTFRGGSAPEEIWLRITHGGAPGPMPAYADKLSPEQRWDVANYVMSLARIAPWQAGGTLDGPGRNPNLSKRGEYIVHAQMCGLCHTEVGTDAIYRNDTYLAGGMRITAYPYGVFVSRNLTSDKDTGVGSWTPEQLTDAIRFGQTPERALNFFAMPWTILHQLNENDANAIGTYLTQNLMPIERRMPAPGQYGFIESNMQKIRGGLPVAIPERLTYASGNFAEPFLGVPRDLPQTVLIALQWIVLLAGIGGILYLTVRRRQLPQRPRGWIWLVLGCIGLLVCALLLFAINGLPGIIPPDQIVANASGAITPPNTQGMTAEQKAMAERGMYLYSSSCILCHNPNAAGGQKNNGLGAGTMWSRNISPDAATGIGSWDEAQIARAIRSGVSKDGRPLYWQAMPWDHFSNLDEEDVRSLAVYLKAIPPTSQEVPLPLPPAPGDCIELNVFIGVNLKPGCQ